MKENLVMFLKKYEGFEPRVYKDIAGFKTIGIGTLWKSGMPTEVTLEQAVDFCWTDCEKILKFLSENVKVFLTDNQKIALTSLAYNVGVGALRTSTLLKKLNAGDYAAAADEFLKWDKATVNGVKKVVKGLTIRRVAEREKFLEKDGVDQSIASRTEI